MHGIHPRTGPGILLVLVALAALVGCDAGCATSKPFAEGITRGVPLMEKDLRHFAGDDPLRVADVNALLADAKDPIDVAKVERSWNSVKAWYLPAIDASSLDANAKAVRRSAADRLDKLIKDEKDRPLRSP